MGDQTLYIRLPAGLARKLYHHVEAQNSGYLTIDEFVSVSVRNQLNLEAHGYPLPSHSEDSSTGSVVSHASSQSSAIGKIRELELLAVLPSEPPVPLAPRDNYAVDRMFVLTNRLSQVKIAARVCGNLSKEGSWPTLRDFQRSAAEVARYVGLALLGGGVKEPEGTVEPYIRMHVGYPIGSDFVKAQLRFAKSFTITSGDRLGGPLGVLGLANVIDGCVVLTDAGWRLASLPNPILRETADGVLLSAAEARELRARLREAPAEARAIGEFLHAVRRAKGAQTKIDTFLNKQHPEWNMQLLVAHRAAMVGRLTDVDVVAVEGRGTTAFIKLLPAATEFTNAEESKLDG